MSTRRFFRYQLRTTDQDAARAFYTDLLGEHFWGPRLSPAPLPERAIALGARPHWLGHVGVDDVEGTVARVVAAGGQPRGPTQRSADGSPVAILRDPFGALLAVSSEAFAAARSPVAWHLLQTDDEARAFALYAALFGWTALDSLDLGPELGRHQMFAWDDSRETVGSVANGARLPHIHPQWLFFFPVSDLEASLSRVQALGGLALSPIKTPRGDLVAPCDDPQGAAFGLYQPALAGPSPAT
jgi:predicted enzyme related to lactoylglutathione lyase